MSAAIIVIVLVCLILRTLIQKYKAACKMEAKHSDSGARNLPQAPGPVAWPVIGNLHLLGRRESPFQVFTDLAKDYGDIYAIKLGSVPCLVVNNLELIREVLNQNGKFFGGRPDFLRFHKLFAGDRNNSLALCDWSNLQLKRRNIARRHCGPRQHTGMYAKIGDIATFESSELINVLREKSAEARTSNQQLKLKPYLMKSAMNMFTHYMCSKRFDSENDAEFQTIVAHFDEIFWEINQGYAVDFLPWLAPFYKAHMEKLSNWSQDIRNFILSRIIEDREGLYDPDGDETDFLEGLFRVLNEDPIVDRNTIMFMLEDFLGGHSSVGNLVMLCLAAIVKNQEIGKRIRDEIDGITYGQRSVNLSDKPSLPFTEATILECLRYSSSPIVPHVATENVNVSGYGVETGTVVFINNYELNTSEKYWESPEKYDPSRFLEVSKESTRKNSRSDSGLDSDSEKYFTAGEEEFKEVYTVKRNIPHFLPFSIGKRTCIGQTLVTSMSFVMLANILQEFEVATDDISDLKQKVACAALPRDTFGLHLVPREKPISDQFQ